MSPQDFPQANITMQPPPGMEDQVQPVRAYHDGTSYVTCWKPSAEERVRIAAGAELYVVQMSSGMPPVLPTLDPWIEQG